MTSVMACRGSTTVRTVNSITTGTTKKTAPASSFSSVNTVPCMLGEQRMDKLRVRQKGETEKEIL